VSWFWLNLPFAVIAFVAVCGLPLLLVIKHPDQAPTAIGETGTVAQTPRVRPAGLAAASTAVWPGCAPAASAERDAA
jgi:hypothetical protein